MGFTSITYNGQEVPVKPAFYWDAHQTFSYRMMASKFMRAFNAKPNVWVFVPWADVYNKSMPAYRGSVVPTKLGIISLRGVVYGTIIYQNNFGPFFNAGLEIFGSDGKLWDEFKMMKTTPPNVVINYFRNPVMPGQFTKKRNGPFPPFQSIKSLMLTPQYTTHPSIVSCNLFQ